MSETALTNARLVLPDRVATGTLVIHDGRIAAIDDTKAEAAQDLDGDYLLPGIVDLHTDNLERQVQPRSNARWPSRSAFLSHDAQCVAAGITTVLDALCAGNLGYEIERVRTFRDGVADLDALTDAGVLKAEHYLHLRCEVPAPDMAELLDPVVAHPRVRLVSLMDHTPGFGQYADVANFRRLRARDGLSDAEIDARIAALQERRERLAEPQRADVLAHFAARHVPIASHDDRTEQEVARNHADGIDISEFPVTEVAASAARARGMQVIAGAPNIVRGGSHTGNVAVADLVRAGLVDALASDYVPASLIEAAFACVAQIGIALPEAVALVTDRPARMAKLTDRGRLEVGLRADLLRVRLHDGVPIVREVWRDGLRIG